MGYKGIKDAIVATLQGVSSLSVVYGKEEKLFSGYPAATVSANNFQGAFQTVGSGGGNKETYQHFIRIYFRTDEANDPDYEDVLESVADDVLAALRHNVKLTSVSLPNGACDYSLPIAGQWKYGTKESPERVFEIIESATVYNPR